MSEEMKSPAERQRDRREVKSGETAYAESVAAELAALNSKPPGSGPDSPDWRANLAATEAAHRAANEAQRLRDEDAKRNRVYLAVGPIVLGVFFGLLAWSAFCFVIWLVVRNG